MTAHPPHHMPAATPETHQLLCGFKPTPNRQRRQMSCSSRERRSEKHGVDECSNRKDFSTAADGPRESCPACRLSGNLTSTGALPRRHEWTITSNSGRTSIKPDVIEAMLLIRSSESNLKLGSRG